MRRNIRRIKNCFVEELEKSYSYNIVNLLHRCGSIKINYLEKRFRHNQSLRCDKTVPDFIIDCFSFKKQLTTLIS